MCKRRLLFGDDSMKLLRKYWNYCTDFSGRTTPDRFWKVFFLPLIFAIPVIALEALITVTFLKDTEPLLVAPKVIGTIWILGLPAMTVRRLRDAGYSARCLLWLLIPVLGMFAIFARLCEKTKN